MKFNTLLAMVAATASLAFAGCEVEKTQEGAIPDVDITTTGEAELPEYDVNAPDVDLGTTETNVTVPTVDVDVPAERDITPAPATAPM